MRSGSLNCNVQRFLRKVFTWETNNSQNYSLSGRGYAASVARSIQSTKSLSFWIRCVTVSTKEFDSGSATRLLMLKPQPTILKRSLSSLAAI